MRLIELILSGLILTTMQADKFPEAEITNGIIKAKLYLSDKDNGYYRSTRFDHSGNIPSLKVNGHEYF